MRKQSQQGTEEVPAEKDSQALHSQRDLTLLIVETPIGFQLEIRHYNRRIVFHSFDHYSTRKHALRARARYARRFGIGTGDNENHRDSRGSVAADEEAAPASESG